MGTFTIKNGDPKKQFLAFRSQCIFILTGTSAFVRAAKFPWGHIGTLAPSAGLHLFSIDFFHTSSLGHFLGSNYESFLLQERCEANDQSLLVTMFTCTWGKGTIETERMKVEKWKRSCNQDSVRGAVARLSVEMIELDCTSSWKGHCLCNGEYVNMQLLLDVQDNATYPKHEIAHCQCPSVIICKKKAECEKLFLSTVYTEQ